MTNKATITVEFTVGCNVEDSYKEAIRLSKKLDVFVQFDFNGVTLLAYENSSVEKGVEEYHKELKINAIVAKH